MSAAPGLQESIALWRQRASRPEAGHAWVRLAELLTADGRTDEALSVLEAEVSRGKACPGALLRLGDLLFSRGRDIEARSHLLRLLGEDPGNTRALRLLAERSAAAGRWTEAVRFYGRLCELQPDHPEWPKALADARQRAEARPRPESLSEGAGRRPLPTMTLVDIYLSQGYRDKALAALREMAAAGPDRQDVQERIAALENGLAAHLDGARSDARARKDGSGGDAPAEGVDAQRLAAVREAAARRRADEKQMFRAWVDNLRRGGE